jgi:hypothetical protein
VATREAAVFGGATANAGAVATWRVGDVNDAGVADVVVVAPLVASVIDAAGLTRFLFTRRFAGGATASVRALSAARVAANASAVASCWVADVNDAGVADVVVLSSLNSTVGSTVSRPLIHTALSHSIPLATPVDAAVVARPLAPPHVIPLAAPVGPAAIIGWFARAALPHAISLVLASDSTGISIVPTTTDAIVVAPTGSHELSVAVPLGSIFVFVVLSSPLFVLKIQKRGEFALSLSHQRVPR